MFASFSNPFQFYISLNKFLYKCIKIRSQLITATATSVFPTTRLVRKFSLDRVYSICYDNLVFIMYTRIYN